MATLLVLWLMVSACEGDNNRTDNSLSMDTAGVMQTADDGYSQLINTEIPEWVIYWKTINPEFDPELFTKSSFTENIPRQEPACMVSANYHFDNQDFVFKKLGYKYYHFSPDSTHIADIYSHQLLVSKDKVGQLHGGLVSNSRVDLIDLVDRTRNPLLSAGIDQGFDEAFWISNHLLLVTGWEGSKPSTRRPVFWEVDLSTRKINFFSYPVAVRTPAKIYLRHKFKEVQFN